MKTRTQISTVILSYIILALLLLTTNPEKMPLPVIIIPFVVILICLFLTINIIIRYVISDLKPKSRFRISLALSAFPVLIIVLQSVNQLTIKDTLITIGLFLLLIFYFKKVDFIR